jgi:hypothetical protein
VKIDCHIQCYRFIRPQCPGVTEEDLGRFVQSTQPDTRIPEPSGSDPSLEARIPPTIRRGREAFSPLARFSYDLKHRTMASLRPWPKVLALDQAVELVRYVSTHETQVDIAFSVNLITLLYLGIVNFQGKPYISQLAETPPDCVAHVITFQAFEGPLFVCWDAFGLRDVSCDPSFLGAESDEAIWFSQIDLRRATQETKLKFQSNVGFLCQGSGWLKEHPGNGHPIVKSAMEQRFGL